MPTKPTENNREIIKKSVADGSFFNDAFGWYIFRYVSPLCDRTWLFFATIISAIIVYSLIVMIINSFPIP